MADTKGVESIMITESDTNWPCSIGVKMSVPLVLNPFATLRREQVGLVWLRAAPLRN